MNEAEYVLPRMTVPQAGISIVKGGDCGALVLAGLTLKPATECYEWSTKQADGSPQSYTLSSLEDAITALGCRDGWDVVTDFPVWMKDVHRGHTAFGFDGLTQAQMWGRYVRMAVQAGYYGVTTIAFQPRDSSSAAGYRDTNHCVMIRGWRFRWEPIAAVPGAKRGVQEVFISCSVKGSYWICVDTLLRDHGAFRVLLARPNA